MCTQSYGPPKSQEYQFWEFRDYHLGVSKQNEICVLALWPGMENTVRGKVVASPKSGPWWVLWIHVCLWFVWAPKCSSYALTNLLFVLCRFVWVIDLLVDQLLLLSLFSLLYSQLSPSRSLGCVKFFWTLKKMKSINKQGIPHVLAWFKMIIQKAIEHQNDLYSVINNTNPWSPNPKYFI